MAMGMSLLHVSNLCHDGSQVKLPLSEGGKVDARERVAAALRELAASGREPTGNDLFRAAIGWKDGGRNSSRAEKSKDGDGTEV